MDIARYKTGIFILAAALTAASLAVFAAFGLQLGVDFTGGSILEVGYEGEAPSAAEVRVRLEEMRLPSLLVQASGDQNIIIRTAAMEGSKRHEILSLLGEGAEELRFESVGPVIGRELRGKTVLLIVLSLAAIVGYIALAFRRVAERVRPWQYSAASLIALVHDLAFMLGLFALLGWREGVHINIPTVIAFLTVLGYSINNTVVVFDRMRENLLRQAGGRLREIVNRSIRETWWRSINTSLTTLFVLAAIFFLGGETLHDFSLALIAGIIAGTFSSLFVAPLLILQWNEGRQS